MPQELECTDGTKTLVDDKFVRNIHNFNLRAVAGSTKSPNKYVRFSNGTGKGNSLRLHRVIMEWILGRKLHSSEMVDHINGNTLDNTQDNLRVATRKQNRYNVGARASKNRTSQYKGVRWMKRRNTWHARIKKDGVEYHLGYFDDERDAARAYNNAAQKYFGEFARLNDV